eukprot:6849962-Heterocapsa_arctica.AAC.1
MARAHGLDDDGGPVSASSSIGTPWSWPSLPKARPRVRNLKIPLLNVAYLTRRSMSLTRR